MESSEALASTFVAEAPEDREAEALAGAGEVGVVGKGLVEVVAQVPPHREAVGRHAHKLPLRAQVLEEKDQLCKRKKTTGSADGLPPEERVREVMLATTRDPR